MCVNWFTTGVIASWWSPLLFSWAISCFVTKVETSGIWVVLEFGELLCPFLGDTILVTILVDLLILELDWESTWRFEVWARRFLSRFLVFCGGKKWIVNLLFQMGEIAFIPSFIYSLSIQVERISMSQVHIYVVLCCVMYLWLTLKRLLWAVATTRDLAADFLLSNCADAHTQHNKKFDWHKNDTIN